MSQALSLSRAKSLWLRAQRLDSSAPFGSGEEGVTRAIEHLGYVQIDTINVIERCHHHILFNRIPTYRREHLAAAQTQTKSVFEYWTHALAYVPIRDFRYFVPRMKDYRRDPGGWFSSVDPDDIRRVLRTIKKEGALTIRDVTGDELVEKTHPWASKKPSKKALELAFHQGRVVISERIGMLKRYELTERHFGWEKFPKAATEKEVYGYRLDRALRSQAFVSLDSVAYLCPGDKPRYLQIIEKRVKAGALTEIKIEGDTKTRYWIEPATLDQEIAPCGLTHLLSPFDPLVIQRKRLEQIFGHEHRFEAYLPKEKRRFGYFALPVLDGDEIVALLDLKTDRAEKRLLIQKWTWRAKFKSAARKARIEKELGRFEDFQLPT